MRRPIVAAFFLKIKSQPDSLRMKNLITFLVIALAFSVQGKSQNSASASVTSRATIVEPITIQKTMDLDFGNVIASPISGTVVLSPDGTRTAYGVSISNSVPGQVNPAEAVVTHGNLSYDISLPDTFTLFNEENPSQTVILNDFTETSLPNIIAEGSDIIKIGATLNLEANQLPGFYTNTAGFSVTVTYN